MPKRWLFITYSPDPKRPILDPSARYRCFNRVEDLRRLGRRAAVVSQQRFERNPSLDFDIYVFHRPWHSQDFEGLLDYLRERGKRLIADYDEPVFAAPLRGTAQPPFPELGGRARSPESQFLRSLHGFDDISASTQPLADWIREIRPAARLEVFGSGISSSWIEMTDALFTDAPKAGPAIALGLGRDMPVDPDLMQQILPATIARNAKLKLLTERSFRNRLHAVGVGTIARQKSLGIRAIAQRCHTVAFPFGTNGEDRTTSAIRGLEAAYMGCRVLAPPIPDFQKHRDAGFTFVDSPEEWIDALQQPPPLSRSEMAAVARAHVLSRGLSEFESRRLLEWEEA